MRVVHGYARPSRGGARYQQSARPAHAPPPAHSTLASALPHRYDFDQHHDNIKQGGFQMDMVACGTESLGSVLFFGDLAAARTGFTKANKAQKGMLARVRQGVASATEYAHIRPHEFHQPTTLIAG